MGWEETLKRIYGFKNVVKISCPLIEMKDKYGLFYSGNKDNKEYIVALHGEEGYPYEVVTLDLFDADLMFVKTIGVELA